MAKKTPEEIVREAEELIRQTQRSLAATRDVYQGAEPQKLGAKEQAEAEALFRKDMEDIEREVAEEAARLSFANAVPRMGGSRKMHHMI